MLLPNDVWRCIMHTCDTVDTMHMRVNKRLAVLALSCVHTIDLSKYYYRPIIELMPNVTSLIIYHVRDIPLLNTFANTTYLDIADTRITGISHMTKLKTLNALKNRSLIDSDISPLTNLTWLNISSGNITNITMLTNLASLTMYDVVSLPSVPTSLRLLALGGNKAPQLYDDQVSILTNLTALDINSNVYITNAGISGLTDMRTLCLRENLMITGDCLRAMTSLTSLDASISMVGDISECKMLTELDMCSSEMYPEHITGLTNLTTLIINDAEYYYNETYQGLSTLTNLTTLVVRSGGFDVSILRHLTNMCHLDIYDTKHDPLWDVSCMPKLKIVYSHGPTGVCAGAQVITSPEQMDEISEELKAKMRLIQYKMWDDLK